MKSARLAVLLLACCAAACPAEIIIVGPIQIVLMAPLPVNSGPCAYTDAFAGDLAKVRVRVIPNGEKALFQQTLHQKEVPAADFANKGIPSNPPWKIDFPTKFCKTKTECDQPVKEGDAPGFLVIELAGLDAEGTITHFAKTGPLRPARGSTKVEAVLWFAKSAENGGFNCTRGEMFKNRERHTATRLHDGRVVILGGRPLTGTAGAVSEIEVYDPKTGEFTKRDDVAMSGDVTPLFDHSAILLRDFDADGNLVTNVSKVFINGGCLAGDKDSCTTAVQDMVLLTVDHQTDRWTIKKLTSKMNHFRARHTATLLHSVPGANVHQARVLLGGGVGEGSLFSGEVCDADLLACNDRGFPQPPFQRNNFCAAQFIDPATVQEKVLLICGNKGVQGGDMFVDGSFSRTTTQLATAREGCRCGMVGSKLFIMGGICDQANSFVSQVESFDFATGQFLIVGSMGAGERRVNHTATATLDRWVIVAGGSTGTSCTTLDTPVGTAVLIDAKAPSGEVEIKSALQMRMARQRHRATLMDDGTVLLTGGANVPTGGLGTAEIWSPPPVAQ